MSFFTLNPSIRPAQLRSFAKLLRPAGNSSVSSIRLLALDVGHKNVGVATSDSFNLFPVHLPTFNLHNGKFAPHIRSIIDPKSKAYSIPLILVGFPLTQRGESGVRCSETLKFISNLRESLKEEKFEFPVSNAVKSAFEIPAVKNSSPITSVEFPIFALWDERFSSSDVRHLLGKSSKINEFRASGKIDSMVAAQFIQDFLGFIENLKE